MTDNLRGLIDGLKLIDQHAHPGFAGYFEDFPPENRIILATDSYRTPENSGADFPYLREAHYEAYEKLYGFSREDINNPAKQDTLVIEYDRQRNNLKHFIDKVMDVANVELLIVDSFLNYDLMNKSQIKFIPAIDPLLFPFDNTYLTNRSPLTTSCLAASDHMLNRIKVKNNYSSKNFTEYLEFVDRVLDNYVQKGAVGFNFFTAFMRNTYCEKVLPSECLRLFERAKKGESAAYNRLQDFLIWHVMRKSVEYNLPVQWHLALSDPYISCFNCLNLSEMICDPIVGKAKIVILSGGYPRFDNTELLALAGGIMPNEVYIDISGCIMFMNHPRILAGTLRKWLEKPILWNKIMYGSGSLRSERDIYVGSKVGRDAVYFALTSMIDDDIIDENTAMVIARKILRENAKKVYNL
jgi:predicted TIM-barrel fold metal-dependent hydrolase